MVAPPRSMREARSSPKVSVITVAFNAGSGLVKTLESVLSQSYAALECVVIDGGSRDGSLDDIARHLDRVDVFTSEPDRGIYDAMNKGIARSSGQFVLFMNCGDCFADAKALERAVETLDGDGEQVLLGSWVRRVSGRADRIVHPSLETVSFNHQAVLYSRSLHERYGPYLVVPGLSTADYLFFATLLAQPDVQFATTRNLIAIIDVDGVSAGLQTFSQKQTIDFLLGRIGRTRLLAGLLLHPTYHTLKRHLGLTR